MSAGETYIRSIAWAWYNQSFGITMDGSNHVSIWADKLLSAHSLLTTGGTPHWSATGVLFDGSDDMMAIVSAINQPVYILTVCNEKTWANGGIFICDSTSSVFIQQNGPSPGQRMFAGGVVGNLDTTLNTKKILEYTFNGASSSMRENNGTAVTGNVGAGNFAGFGIGGVGVFAANVEFQDIVVIPAVPSSANRIAAYNYIASLNSLPTI
jgi:hypothetical protein